MKTNKAKQHQIKVVNFTIEQIKNFKHVIQEGQKASNEINETVEKQKRHQTINRVYISLRYIILNYKE